MKAAHTVLYMNKDTQTYASYPAMEIRCMSLVRLEIIMPVFFAINLFFNSHILLLLFLHISAIIL